MDISKLLQDARAKADSNGDGKLAVDDITSLGEQYGFDQNMIDNLKSRADGNADGKLDLSDLQGAFGNLGDMASGMFDKAKGMFGGK